MSDIDKINIRTADLNLLVAFDALYDTRNVSRAAERLALTQPTVSGMLARLRHMFSDPLFVRTSHGILPTPRAERLAGPVRALLDDARRLLAPETFDPAKTDFTVRLCGSDYVQQAVLGGFAAAIRRHAPGARVSVLPRPGEGLAQMLAEGRFDLSVSIREVAVSGLPTLTLYRDHYVCIARPGHPLAGPRLSLSDLASHPHAFVDPTGASFAGPVDAALAERGHSRRVALAVPTFAMLFDLLAQEDLLAFVPERLLQGQRQRFRRFQSKLAMPGIEVVANWHPRFEAEPRHLWLRGLLCDSVAA